MMNENRKLPDGVALVKEDTFGLKGSGLSAVVILFGVARTAGKNITK
jgi:hypothetical protein